MKTLQAEFSSQSEILTEKKRLYIIKMNKDFRLWSGGQSELSG